MTPAPDAGRTAEKMRYTVIYEGDPAGARILNGEPAPGRAVGVLAGDLAELYRTEDRRADAEIRQLQADLIAARKDAHQQRLVVQACQQVAGKALGYPWFKDDQKNFPGTIEANGVCIGEHVEETIVEELAKAYAQIRAERDGLAAIVMADDAKALAEYEWERANKLAEDAAQLRSRLLQAEKVAEAMRAELSRRPPEYGRALICPKCGTERGIFPACAVGGCPTLLPEPQEAGDHEPR